MLKNQELCIINGGQTTNYFKLKRCERQGDPLSAYLFILIFETAFIKIKMKPNNKSLNVCNNDFLYIAYADNTTFFDKMKNRTTEVLNNFNNISQFLVLKLANQNVKWQELESRKGYISHMIRS